MQIITRWGKSCCRFLAPFGGPKWIPKWLLGNRKKGTILSITVEPKKDPKSASKWPPKTDAKRRDEWPMPFLQNWRMSLAKCSFLTKKRARKFYKKAKKNSSNWRRKTSVQGNHFKHKIGSEKGLESDLNRSKKQVQKTSRKKDANLDAWLR